MLMGASPMTVALSDSDITGTASAAAVSAGTVSGEAILREAISGEAINPVPWQWSHKTVVVNNNKHKFRRAVLQLRTLRCTCCRLHGGQRCHWRRRSHSRATARCRQSEICVVFRMIAELNGVSDLLLPVMRESAAIRSARVKEEGADGDPSSFTLT